MEPEEFLDVGERVVVVLSMRAKGLSSGVALERRDAMVFQLRDGKTMRLVYYNSRKQALEAVGLTE
jgi:ketosteroid isomerase-like protein